MNKRLRILSLVLVVTFSSNIMVLAESSSSLQEKIDQNQNNINDLENEKGKVNDEIENQNAELQSILDKIDEKSRDLEAIKADVNEYQIKIDEVQNEINNINNEIIIAEEDIKVRENLIIQKEEEEKSIQEALSQRIRSYYKIDINSNYIYMVLKSENVISLFNTIENIFRIVNLDKNLIKEAKKIQKELEKEKKEISNKLEEIENNKNGILVRQDELKEAQKEFIAKQKFHQEKMNELYALESQKSGLIASLSGKEKEIEEQIGDLISYNKELQEALDDIFTNINNSSKPIAPSNPNPDNSQGNTDGGSDGLGDSGSENGSNGVVGDPNTETFLRPGYGVVTDPYGPRINPVTGEAGFHTGVDLGDPYGSPVAASKSGVVAYSGWIQGYGNTIIIDHGGGVQTLYAHNSELLVGVGQTVGRGQTIALVGSTGMSTGPHIHWEIRINGQHVNPMSYV